MDQDGSFPGEDAGAGGPNGGAEPAAVRSRSVFDAAPVPEESVRPDGPAVRTVGPAVRPVGPATDRNGFGGALVLQGVEALNEEQTGAALSRMDHLIRWAQAQQAKLLDRLQTVYRDEIEFATGKLEPGMAFSLAAEEAATILGLPTGTGKMLMNEADSLCGTHTATLTRLEAGGISYGHVQTVLEQSVGVPPAGLAGFEKDLLAVADGQTKAQFQVKARRLRETNYPESITKRQLTAFEKRRVCLQPEADGMSWLSAFLPAEKAQALFTQLTKAARGEQSAGDPRTVDQLRADILQHLLEAGGQGTCGGCGGGDAAAIGGTGKGAGISGGRGRKGTGGKAPVRNRARTEVLVIITAETLCGADEQPAELHGYGPISPETARRMVREAAKWTPVERDPDTEEILRVGRRRKVPAGLQRWLRARDGTCRFPGCRTNAVISEIDHTKPWAQGGATDHDNLEYLCRRHHMFKTEGFWKACQPKPGIIEWTSPGGRTYRTEPHLTYASTTPGSIREPGAMQEPRQEPAPKPVHARQPVSIYWDAPAGEGPGDYGGDPPPF